MWCSHTYGGTLIPKTACGAMVRRTGPRPGMPNRTPGHKAIWRDSTREGPGHSCHRRPHSCVGVTPCFRGMPRSCLLEVEKYVSFNCSWSLENLGRGISGDVLPWNRLALKVPWLSETQRGPSWGHCRGRDSPLHTLSSLVLFLYTSFHLIREVGIFKHGRDVRGYTAMTALASKN